MDEYKQTVMGAAPFKGDSIELLRAVYRGDYLATHDQIYAAGQCLRFEHPPAVTVDGRSVEQIRDEVRQELQGDPEENRRELQAVLDTFITAAIRETRARINGPARGAGAPAWVAALVTQVLGEAQFLPAPEIVPPEPARARHARRAPTIDNDEPLNRNQVPEGEKVAETLVPDAAVPTVSAPCPEPSPEKPVDADMIEINVPTRSGVLTRYIPRVK
jgi:hypothetical protein